MSNELPLSFYCPLTQEVMEDPVIDHEGNSYERAAITNWLERNATSPITRSPLQLFQLSPNRALRELIQAHAPAGARAGASAGAGAGAVAVSPAAASASASAVGAGAMASYTVLPGSSPEEMMVVASFSPPDLLERDPCDICAVVDVSGSMGSESTIQGAGGKAESHGLSLLDVVKHAVKTVIAVLQPRDRFALVSFSRVATLVLPLTLMDAGGKARANRALEALDADGNTNLWDGLANGLNVLRDAYTPGRNQSVMLLTDGEPNVIPPRGHIPMLLQYKEKFPAMASVNTFGFGYSLDSVLLDDLASEGGGQYAFIPDASLVGTVFVHTLANTLSTCCRRLTLSFEPADAPGFGITDAAGRPGVCGGLVHDLPSWGALVHCGSGTHGQPRSACVRVKVPAGTAIDPSLVTVTARYSLCGSSEVLAVPAVPTPYEAAPSTLTPAQAQYCRSLLVDTIRACITLCKTRKFSEAMALCSGVSEELQALADRAGRGNTNTAYVKSLVGDLQGQVAEAVGTDAAFTKWGRHFLPSLARAHQMQQCNNFKDPGVQSYGGTLFKRIRDAADEAFLKIPPPTPSVTAVAHAPRARSSVASASPARAAAAAAPVDMSMYYNRGGGCVHGDCVAALADGSHKRVSSLRAGDMLVSERGLPVKLVCLVGTATEGGRRELFALPGGLQLTGYHPVAVQEQGALTWTFPCTLTTPRTVACDVVYTFVVQSVGEGALACGVVVNGVCCAVLGHGRLGDSVLSHAYLGTSAVLRDLSRVRGFACGSVLLPADAWSVRDEHGLICGLNVTVE